MPAPIRWRFSIAKCSGRLTCRRIRWPRPPAAGDLLFLALQSGVSARRLRRHRNLERPRSWPTARWSRPPIASSSGQGRAARARRGDGQDGLELTRRAADRAACSCTAISLLSRPPNSSPPTASPMAPRSGPARSAPVEQRPAGARELALRAGRRRPHHRARRHVRHDRSGRTATSASSRPSRSSRRSRVRRLGGEAFLQSQRSRRPQGMVVDFDRRRRRRRQPRPMDNARLLRRRSTTCCARTTARTARSGGRRTCAIGRRPGRLLVGASVAAPGKTREAAWRSTSRTGKRPRQLTLADELAAPPLFIAARSPVPRRLAMLSGGLNNRWKLTLAGPPPATLPSMPVEPLTALPGLVVPRRSCRQFLPNSRRQPPDAFLDPLRRRRRERQPDVAAARCR